MRPDTMDADDHKILCGKAASRIYYLLTNLFERQPCRIANITAVSLEQGMRLIPDDEHNVRGHFPPRLVALLLERDFGARLPAGLHRYADILVLPLGRAVRLQHPLRNLHLLHATLIYLVQCHVHVMFYCRILGLLLL